MAGMPRVGKRRGAYDWQRAGRSVDSIVDDRVISEARQSLMAIGAWGMSIAVSVMPGCVDGRLAQEA